MRSYRHKILFALPAIGVACVLLIVARRAKNEWSFLAGAAALATAVCAGLWLLVTRLGTARSERVLQRPSELSTLAFPPSSFRK
jgi:hypothetical protein